MHVIIHFVLKNYHDNILYITCNKYIKRYSGHHLPNSTLIDDA